MSPTFIAAYDGSDASRSAVQLAVRLGRAEHADVIAVHVYPRVPPTHPPAEVPEADRELQDDVRVAGQVVLDALDVPGVAGRRLVCGSPAHTLHDLAAEHGASLIAVGLTHHKRLGRLIPGSVGAKLLHGAPCAVAAVPRGMGDARTEALASRTTAVASLSRPSSRASDWRDGSARISSSSASTRSRCSRAPPSRPPGTSIPLCAVRGPPGSAPPERCSLGGFALQRPASPGSRSRSSS